MSGMIYKDEQGLMVLLCSPSAQALLRTLCSLPTRSPLLNALPLLVNTALLFFVLDLLYTPKYFFGSEDLTFIRCAH